MRSTFFAIGLLLAAPVAAKEKPQVPAELAPTHGYVHVAFPKGNGEALSVRPVGGDKVLELDTPATALQLPNAQAFGKWLPAGRYRVAGWGPREWKDGPEFEVQSGRVTDLGDLVIASVGGYQSVLVPIPHREYASAMAAATQPFASVLKDATLVPFEFSTVSPTVTAGQPASGLGLIADLLVAYERKVNKPSTREALKAAKDPAEFLGLMRAMTVPLQDEPARLADGTLYFPADFGQLRKRSPNGEWSSVGIDSVRQLLAVEYADDRLLAGSDDGRIRESRDDGKSWTDVKALGRQEAVLDIDHANGAWIVSTTERFDDPNAARGGGFVVATKGTPSVRLRVYVAQRDDLGDLAVSKEFTLAPKDQVGWLGARGQLVDGRYYIMAGTALQRLDVASSQWAAITPGPRISSHRVDPTTGVITAFWSQGAFSKVYVSSDRGDSWALIGRPPYIINDVQMDAVDRGWASRWNMNAFSGVWETYTFVPAKNDWDKSGEAPFNCRLMRIAKEPLNKSTAQ
ncbi:MAG: hypothetical protein ACREPE_12230 [Lysobacter sp.]